MAGPVESLAEMIGARTDALTLLITLLAGYPLGFVYRQFLYSKAPWLQHAYFICCGLTLGYVNFGTAVVHSAANILIIYVTLLCCGGTRLSIFLSFAINMGYLHVGYVMKHQGAARAGYHTWTLPHCVLSLRLLGVVFDVYDEHQPTYLCLGYSLIVTTVYTVAWTTPQCVLTLRLIGLAFDIYDGHKKPDKLSAEQKETALTKTPSLLEVAGHAYFYGGFLVGPQFPMRRYLDFTSGAYSDPVTGDIPASVRPAFVRLSAGLFYTLVFQLGALYIPDSYLLSPDFEHASLLMKCFIITLWGKISLYKYLACWLISEGTCILTGMTYNGKDENGNDLWDACANIKIRNFESANSCQQVITAFNINTNQWMAKYIFKRLKFLGNKDISQATTLFFLAIWHGLFSGYFMNFFLEFPIIKFERELSGLLMQNHAVSSLVKSPVAHPFVWVFCRLYSQFAVSYALVSFNFLSYEIWGWVYWQVYFVGHIIFCGWVVFYPIYRSFTRPKKHRTHQNGVHEKPVESKKEL